jgi:cell wall-associated NlpC family hydrolase
LLMRKLRWFLLFVCLGVVAPLHAQAETTKESAEPSQISSLLAKAKTYLGLPYRYGGMSPKGFDCSGFVRYVFGSMGIDLDRTSGSQAKQGDPIDLAHIQPGDLLFFSTRGMRKGISHVGIYLGEGRFIHASNWGGSGRHGVKLSELASNYFSDRLVAIRRVVTQLGNNDNNKQP